MDHYLSAADIAAMPEREHQHQFNNNAIRLTRALGDHLGLERLGVSLIRLAQGRDSTQHHYHEADEEFIYIISGQGTAKIGDAYQPVGPGDFMAFSSPSAAHSLYNPNPEDLVYLLGGERNFPDIVHYPDDNKAMFKAGKRRQWVARDTLVDVKPAK